MEISSLLFSDDYPSFILQDSTPTKKPRYDFDYDSSVIDFVTKILEIDNPIEQTLSNEKIQSFSAGTPRFNPLIQEMKSESESYSLNKSPPRPGISSNTKRARSESEEIAVKPEDSTSLASGNVSNRRLWVKNRSNAWWEEINSPDCSEIEFKKAFRMSKATFDMICEELELVLTKKDTMLRMAIPVRQRVAVCIWRLATGEALREVSKKFGLGISTCHKLVLEGCTAIKTVLMPKVLQWPDENRMREIKRDFENLSGISNVGGSMYTTHIPIIAPKVNVGAYFNKRHTERNQKTSYSITVQGVVDTRGVFTDICIGWPGSMTDDQVLEKSALFQRANKGALKDVSVVGSSGYPLMDWVLVPYAHQHLTWTQHAYNEKVEKVQKVAKDSFMRLKARWSCLQKRTEMKLQDLPVVLGACCVLHNICEMRNEGLAEELRFDLFDDEMIPENSVRSVNAMHARDQIAHKLLHYNQFFRDVIRRQNKGAPVKILVHQIYTPVLPSFSYLSGMDQFCKIGLFMVCWQEICSWILLVYIDVESK